MATNPPNKRRRGRPEKYPWSKWLAPGQTTVIEKYVDFTCELTTMVGLIARTARSRKVKATARVNDLTITLQVK